MRHEASYLKDILRAAEKIKDITAASSEASFIADEVLPAAVLHHLTVIGEAINRLSPELRDRHPEVPWRQIVSVRHRIVHAYFDLDLQIVWTAAAAEIPHLREQIARILAREFPESG
ncbi:MAG: DUF86 domain-containing protein [Bryobacteraceae bacterium]|nr:DUF86 domain-containing protein [Bryobacteraceae bacterium]